MALTQDDKIRSSPRASKDPKSYEYARQMVYVLKTIWTQITFDMKDWQKEVEEARQNKIWEQLGYESIDEVLKKEVGYSEAELKLKCKQARDNPLAKNGTNQHSDLADRALDAKDNPLAQHRGGDNVTPSSRGNDTDYTLRRLARDKPELLDAIERGELSVNAAAIKAGIRKKQTPDQICVREFAKVENRISVLRAIFDRLQPHEKEIVLDWIDTSLEVAS
jgi:hypothetical protein